MAKTQPKPGEAHSGKYVSYIRVSTARQGASGLGLEAQRQAIAGFLNGGRWEIISEHVEVESGKNDARPELARALSVCRLRKATLIVAKLDRLARNVHFLSALMESGVEFLAVDLPQANRFTLHILAAVAEHEAKMISERTRAGLAVAKQRGRVLGGLVKPNGGLRIAREQWLEATVEGRKASLRKRVETAGRFVADVLPVIDDLRAQGATSLRQIAAGLNERGFTTPRGGEWNAVQVQRVLKAKEAA